MDIGTTLSQYRITAKLGEGGMGEVYRAEDTRLRRDVAIKVLPAELAEDPDRLARLEREAQVLAQLEHPNVAAVYGLEEAVPIAPEGATEGVESGAPAAAVRFLVMQLAEGDTLDELLDRRGGVGGSGRVSTGAVTAAPATAPATASGGPGTAAARDRGLPIDEILPIAGGIADALEAAHERGIVHRDLKPANIKVAFDDGVPKVKVLDFGLAKAYQPEATSGGEDLSASPTMMAATQAGMIMGTAGYMSPEQARGQPVNQRTDIWAFGVVLYEMLTGRALFASETISDTMAAVLRDEIDLDTLPPDTPLPLRRVLRRCLRRETRKRLRDIADARVEIDEAFAGLLGIDAEEIAMLVERGGVELSVPESAAAGRAAGFTWLHALLGVVLLAAGAIAGSFIGPAVAPPDPPVLMFGDLGPVVARSGVISPDGTKLALDIRGDLWVRDVDTLDAVQVEGGEQFRGRPFWSPDSTRFAFVTDGLRIALASDGSSRSVSTGDLTRVGATGAWGHDGIIVETLGRQVAFVLIDPDSGSSRTVARATAPGLFFDNPLILPDRQTLVYELVDRSSRVATGSVVMIQRGLSPDAETEILLDESDSYSGFWYSEQLEVLLIESPTTGVWTLPLSRSGFRQTGPIERLFRDAEDVSLSDDGTLVYRALTRRLDSNPLRWIDRSGAVVETIASDLGATKVSLSPDGTRVAFSAPREAGTLPDVWVNDLERGGQTRITDQPGTGGSPGWLGDDTLVYAGALVSINGTGTALRTKASSGAGGAPIVLEGFVVGDPDGSRDGRFVVFAAVTEGGAMRPADPEMSARFLAGGRAGRGAAGGAAPPPEGQGAGSDEPARRGRGSRGNGSAFWNLYYLRDGGPDPTIYRATEDNEIRPAVSPDATRIAYVSDASGAQEVWVDTFPTPSEPVRLSVSGARNVRWSPLGDEVFFDNNAGTLWSVRLVDGEPHGRDAYLAPERLFSSGDVYSRFSVDGQRAWDVGPEGESFLTVQRYAEGTSPVNVIVNFPRWYRERRGR